MNRASRCAVSEATAFAPPNLDLTVEPFTGVTTSGYNPAKEQLEDFNVVAKALLNGKTGDLIHWRQLFTFQCFRCFAMNEAVPRSGFSIQERVVAGPKFEVEREAKDCQIQSWDTEPGTLTGPAKLTEAFR